jgi:hypothetical protein
MSTAVLDQAIVPHTRGSRFADDQEVGAEERRIGDLDAGLSAAQMVAAKVRAVRRPRSTDATQPTDPQHTGKPQDGVLPFSAVTIASVARVARPGPSVTFQPLQEWEGYIYSIKDETFWARMVDITARESIEGEEAEFLISDLSDEDRTHLAIGAVIRWVIGYQRSAQGTKRRVSEVLFRRLPAHTPYDLAEARKRAAALQQSIDWK